MKVSVIIATRDADLLDLCLRAHRRFTPGGVEFFVIDTSGGDDLYGVCAEAEWRGMTVRHEPAAPEDKTYSAWNADGANHALDQGADLLVFANDDAIVTPDWLPTMLEDAAGIASAGHRLGALGACSNAVSGPQACIGSGGRRRNGVVLCGTTPGSASLRAFDRPMPIGPVYSFFMAVPAEAYRACGGWDVDLPTHCGSDDVLSARLVAAGYSLWMSRAFVAHFGSETLLAQGVDRAKENAAFREYVRGRYSAHFDALGRWIGGTGVAK